MHADFPGGIPVRMNMPTTPRVASGGQLLRFALLCCILPVVAGTACAAGYAQSDSAGYVTGAPDTVDASGIEPFSRNDGPHIFWQSDSIAVIFYLCHDSLVQARRRVIDTLRFAGLCLDSAVHYTVPAADPFLAPDSVGGASKVYAVSDIHGEYEALKNILRAGGVVDDHGRWIWGDGHLVVAGDVFDRGLYVTECLWYIYGLEQEARSAGGRVHLLLGNHELIVLRGDLRYVHEKYLKGICRTARIPYDDLYGPDMELGRWLRSKPTVLKIDSVLFVHGGLSPECVDRSLSRSDLNLAVRHNLDITPPRLASSDLPRFLFGSLGPFWYRGYHYEMEGKYPQASGSELSSILEYYGVGRVVVGHSEVDSVSGLYDNRVLAIDVPLEELGSLQALLWRDGRFYRVHGDGSLTDVDDGSVPPDATDRR